MDAVVQHPQRPSYVHVTRDMERRMVGSGWPPHLPGKGIRQMIDTIFGAKPVWDAQQFMVT